MPSSTAVLIVAAGRGTRASAASAAPKQYVMLGERTVLAHAVERFLRHNRIGFIQMVIHRDDRAAYDDAVRRFGAEPRLLPPVFGGATRQQSAMAGLWALENRAPHNVLIHDAARPFLSPDVIDRVLDRLAHARAAIVAIPVSDTLKRVGNDGVVIDTLARDGLWLAQTPQGFHFASILAAHSAAAAAGRHDFTDDAAVAEWHGLPVTMVMGDPANTKLTTAEEIRMAEAAHSVRSGDSMPDIRTGQGFDVHRFCAGDHVWLCGVRIPHTHGVEAHSDGDVGLHALTDALLGAIADGDIGQHFKNSDPRWKDAASHLFLADAVSRVGTRDGRIANVDVTVICEAPKIATYRHTMRRRMAEILGIDIGRVGLKATTTEQLGFAGRKEGLAAMAIATVIMSGGS